MPAMFINALRGTDMALMILRLPAVKARTGLSRSALYLRVAQGRFPQRISLGGGRAVGWISDEIEAWIERQIEASRSTKGTGRSRAVEGLAHQLAPQVIEPESGT